MNDRITVSQPALPPMSEYIDEISSLWDSRILSNMGEKHELFAKLLSERFEGVQVSLFTNGHSALECAFAVLGLEGQVITTPYTFASTTNAIVRSGLEPVFADIRLSDFNIDPSCIEALIGPRTCAIVPVHVYGNPCDVLAVQDIADRYGLKVVYDAAHAFGSKYRGVSVCSYGDASMVSFAPTKVMHSAEGGALFYRDGGLAKAIELYKNFGQAGGGEVAYPGCNAKLNEFNAAMGICNLRHVDDLVARRLEFDALYRALLADVDGIAVSSLLDDACGNGAYFPVLVEEDYPLSRDGLMMLLDSHGIESRRYFWPLTSDFSCYEGQFDSSLTPRAAFAAAHVLALPLHTGLSESDVTRICSVIRRAGS